MLHLQLGLCRCQGQRRVLVLLLVSIISNCDSWSLRQTIIRVVISGIILVRQPTRYRYHLLSIFINTLFNQLSFYFFNVFKYLLSLIIFIFYNYNANVIFITAFFLFGLWFLQATFVLANSLSSHRTVIQRIKHFLRFIIISVFL